MGAGKSTIGRQLADKLDYQFLDTDHIIETRTGADIPWIFDVEGESGFRNRESDILTEIINTERAVIATGGGIVMREGNRKLLQLARLVIYLTADVEQLVKRMFKDKKRPLLQVENPEARIKELFELRDPIYRQVADQVIVTDISSTKNVVHKITGLVHQH